MNRVAHITTLASLPLLASLLGSVGVYAQAFYDTEPSRSIYVPTEGEDGNLFKLNPAMLPTTPQKVGGYALRKQHNATYIAPDDERTKTEASIATDSYGAMAMFDLGAGTAAGISMQRVFTDAKVKVSSVQRVPYEKMMSQTASAHILIDLAPGFRLGLNLRWMSERGDIMGSPFASITDERITYSGSLVGHGGGLSYSQERFKIGAAYFPAARGKSEILYEQRIISEPGVGTLDGSYKFGQNTFGLGLERSVHRRDERSQTVVSETGNRNVTLDGISPTKNLFPRNAYHASGDLALNGQWTGRLGVTQREKQFVFDDTLVPSDSDEADRVSYLELQLSIRYTAAFDVMAGYQFCDYAKTLTNKSGGGRSGGSFKGSERSMFMTAGTKF